MYELWKSSKFQRTPLVPTQAASGKEDDAASLRSASCATTAEKRHVEGDLHPWEDLHLRCEPAQICRLCSGVQCAPFGLPPQVVQEVSTDARPSRLLCPRIHPDISSPLHGTLIPPFSAEAFLNGLRTGKARRFVSKRAGGERMERGREWGGRRERGGG